MPDIVVRSATTQPPVTQIQQPESDLCWATCVNMVVAVLKAGSPILRDMTPQRIQARLHYESLNIGQPDTMIKVALENYGCTATLSNRSLTDAEIITAIDANHPIIVGMSWGQGGGHAMVIGGYTEKSVSGLWVDLYDPLETAVKLVYAEALRKGNYAGQTGGGQGARSNQWDASLVCRLNP